MLDLSLIRVRWTNVNYATPDDQRNPARLLGPLEGVKNSKKLGIYLGNLGIAAKRYWLGFTATLP